MTTADDMPVADIVVEVRLPNRRWLDIYRGAGNDLDTGVGAVCILDPQLNSAFIHYSDHAPRVCAAKGMLRLPE